MPKQSFWTAIFGYNRFFSASHVRTVKPDLPRTNIMCSIFSAGMPRHCIFAQAPPHAAAYRVYTQLCQVSAGHACQHDGCHLLLAECRGVLLQPQVLVKTEHMGHSTEVARIRVQAIPGQYEPIAKASASVRAASYLQRPRLRESRMSEVAIT